MGETSQIRDSQKGDAQELQKKEHLLNNDEKDGDDTKQKDDLKNSRKLSFRKNRYEQEEIQINESNNSNFQEEKKNH